MDRWREKLLAQADTEAQKHTKEAKEA